MTQPDQPTGRPARREKRDEAKHLARPAPWPASPAGGPLPVSLDGESGAQGSPADLALMGYCEKLARASGQLDRLSLLLDELGSQRPPKAPLVPGLLAGGFCVGLLLSVASA